MVVEVIRTDRLVLRWLSLEDAEFIYELVNDAEWIRHIGDRGVRSLEDARTYLLQGPIAMYTRVGFGLYRVELQESRVPVGICGLLKRDSLDDVDVGFAFLPRFRSHGYALEAARATLEYGERQLGLSRIVAIVSPGNHASIQLLQKLGLGLERMVRLADGEDEVCLFCPVPVELSPSGDACPS
jgi:RimJ/RimL family protein N-acetyltransferase